MCAGAEAIGTGLSGLTSVAGGATGIVVAALPLESSVEPSDDKSTASEISLLTTVKWTSTLSHISHHTLKQQTSTDF